MKILQALPLIIGGEIPAGGGFGGCHAATVTFKNRLLYTPRYCGKEFEPAEEAPTNELFVCNASKDAFASADVVNATPVTFPQVRGI
jgi:hypothetical protein